MTLVTVTVKTFSKVVVAASVVRTQILYEEIFSKLKEFVALSVDPKMLNAALPECTPLHPETSEYVAVSPASTSVVLSVPTIALEPAFSAIEFTLREMSVGVSLTFVTVIVNVLSKVEFPASVVRTQIA